MQEPLGRTTTDDHHRKEKDARSGMIRQTNILINKRKRSSIRPDAEAALLDEPLHSAVEGHIKAIMASKQRKVQKFHEMLKEKGEEDWADAMRNICDELGINVTTTGPWLAETWFTLFRLRQAFFLMCAFSILLSLFTGFLMEIFFSVMGGAHIQFSDWFQWIKWHAMFWVLPLLMMFLAVLGDEMCDLILDSLDYPPLGNFQATLLTALHSKSEEVESARVKFADCGMFLIFEAVPVLFAVLSYCCLKPFFGVGGFTLLIEGYVQGSLLSALFCTAIFVFADMVKSRAQSKEGEEHTGRAVLIADKIDSYKMKPYNLRKHQGLWKAVTLRFQEGMSAGVLAQHEQRQQTKESRRVIRRPSTKFWVTTAMVIVLIVWTVACCVFAKFNKETDWFDPIVMGLALILTVCVFSMGLQTHFPDLVRAPYFLILCFFVLVGLFLSSTSAVKAADDKHGGPMQAIFSFLPEEGLPAGDLPAVWPGRAENGAAQPYPVCSMSWGAPDARVGALDLANLAWIVYDSASVKDAQGSLQGSNMQQMLRASFGEERQVQLVNATEYAKLPRWAHFYFPPSGNGTRGTRVVAVKGTSTVMDALVDTNLFSTVKILQIFQSVLPVLTVLPRLVIQWLLSAIHLRTSRQAEQHIWESLEAEVRRMMREHPQDSFVITGHSLGGGLSQVVAAKLFVPALVWSAPGAELSARRFGVEVQSLKRNVVSVMPDHDVVPRVDIQGGTVQLVECRRRDGTEESSLRCHSLVKTACEVWRACGDQRDFRRSCGQYVAPRDLGHLYRVDDTTA